MAKEVQQVIKIQLQAGKATPAPPVGTVLGPTGVNIAQVTKDYNALTANKQGIIPAVITIYDDRSYSLEIKTSPTPELIKQKLKIKKGSGVPNKEKVGKLTLEQVREIAEEKMPDLNAASVESAMRMVEGTARSMGVEIAS
jgi:large subunit ribosomal protein L11